MSLCVCVCVCVCVCLCVCQEKEFKRKHRLHLFGDVDSDTILQYLDSDGNGQVAALFSSFCCRSGHLLDSRRSFLVCYSDVKLVPELSL